jgi:hypothetical protein
MSNLTFDHRLLKEHTPDPLEGHAVVVFERVGTAGDGFHSVLMPGAAPVKPPLVTLPFRKRPEYFAYAVDVSPQRHLDFNESMRLPGRMVEFRVVISLGYAVSDPRALATARDLDPLRRVRDQVRVVVRREMELLPREALSERFPEHARMVVDGCMDEVCDHARSYGLAIRSLRLEHRLPPEIEDIYHAEQRVLAERESEQQRINHDRILSMRNNALADEAMLVEGSHRLKATVVETTIAAAARGETATMHDGIKQINLLHTGGGPAAGWSTAGAWSPGGAAGPQAIAPAVPDGVRALGAGTAAGGGAVGALLGDVLSATSVVQGPQRKKVRAALLHLAAEMLMDGLGDDASIERYARSARDAIDGLSPSPGGVELDALKALANPDRLRDRL